MLPQLTKQRQPLQLGLKMDDIMRKVIPVFIGILTLFTFSLQAQRSAEIGVVIGASSYYGDLSPQNAQSNTSQYQPSFSFFYRQNVNSTFGFRANLAYGRLTGDDSLSDQAFRQERNFDFESSILELGLIGEINLFGFAPGGNGSRFSPYLFGGVALFHFNPLTEYEGQTVELQPLGTEGQGMEGFQERYRLTQISIPFGGGIKYAINDHINIGLELGFRKTFTDYLDDVSGAYVPYPVLRASNGELAAALGNRTGEFLGTEPVEVQEGALRGNPLKDDWYLMGGFTLTYTIFSDRGGYGKAGRRGGKQFGCPTF